MRVFKILYNAFLPSVLMLSYFLDFYIDEKSKRY